MNFNTEQEKNDWEDMQFINELRQEFAERQHQEMIEWQNRELEKMRNKNQISTYEPIRKPRGRQSHMNVVPINPEHYFQSLNTKIKNNIEFWGIIDIIRPLSPSQNFTRIKKKLIRYKCIEESERYITKDKIIIIAKCCLQNIFNFNNSQKDYINFLLNLK